VTDETLRTYQQAADRYVEHDHEPAPEIVAWQRRFVDLLPRGADVLEIGSGPGRDADGLESMGVRVRRTDATPAFVDRLRALGREAAILDVRHDPLPADLDGAFAGAVLLHLDRDAFAAALARIRDALRPGGVLACTLKEGDGEETHSRKLGLPRTFTYWREVPLRAALETARLEVLSIEHRRGEADDWLMVLARRPS
jgi:SAM-dependent methyltransferase